ncbi:MAG: spore coat protein YlbD [Bacilli bacterium]
MKQEEFKNFIKTKPELIKFVQSGEMTWQKFYELYDIYGEDENVWNKYILNNDRSTVDSINKITNMVKNVNVDSIKSHINTAQKAIDFVQDLTKKTPQNITNNLSKGPVSPRPLNKFFED